MGETITRREPAQSLPGVTDLPIGTVVRSASPGGGALPFSRKAAYLVRPVHISMAVQAVGQGNCSAIGMQNQCNLVEPSLEPVVTVCNCLIVSSRSLCAPLRADTREGETRQTCG